MGLLILICIPIAVGVSLCWYLPCVKAQPKPHVLKKNDYLKLIDIAHRASVGFFNIKEHLKNPCKSGLIRVYQAKRR